MSDSRKQWTNQFHAINNIVLFFKGINIAVLPLLFSTSIQPIWFNVRILYIFKCEFHIEMTCEFNVKSCDMHLS